MIAGFEDVPPVPLRLKVETNTREHFSVYGLRKSGFEVESTAPVITSRLLPLLPGDPWAGEP